jgi:alkylated DNA repair dioxygenase AlkB
MDTMTEVPVLSWQASLFDGGAVMVDHGFKGLRRIQLDDDSWVDHAPGWLSGSDELFASLLTAGDWRQRQRWMYDKEVAEPRLTAGFDVAGQSARLDGDQAASALAHVVGDDVDDLTPGGDAGTAADQPGLPINLGHVCGTLSGRYGVDFDRVWVNLYRDGRDSVAWHGDRNARVIRNPLVATVSLGAQRKFQLRRAGETHIRLELRPGSGDLIVMGGSCQHLWEHCVPKTRRPMGPRMSVTIRHSEGKPI